MADSASAWTHYWQTGQAHSCINTQTSDGAELAGIWGELALTLKGGARVLDLATGNGAVAELLVTRNPELHITGIDHADIAPAKSQVSYLGNVDITKLPFADKSFDVVTSQFGFEYAAQTAAAREAARVLADGGRLCFLLHHPHSAIVESNSHKIPEIEGLLSPDGLLDQCRDCLNDELSFADLENAGQAYLASNRHRSRQISGQVFEAIGTLFDLKQRTPALAQSQLAALVARITDEGDRLRQMRDAAVSEAQVNDLIGTFADAGITLEAPELFHTGVNTGVDGTAALIGWLLRGKR